MVNNSLNNAVYEDFSVENGASGSSRVLCVENNNDTASSSAAIETQVGGTSADDTYFRYLISTTNSWAHGIDQTDSQSFDIAYNAGATATPSSIKAIKSTTDGELLYPNQPLFAAYRSSSLTNVTGDGTDYTIIYDAEDADQDSNYNTATGTFTAPKEGKYLFSSVIMLDEVSTSHTGGYFRILVNGVEVTRYLYDAGAWVNAYDECGLCGTIVIDLAASDTVTTKICVYGYTKTIDLSNTDRRTTFGGCLLG